MTYTNTINKAFIGVYSEEYLSSTCQYGCVLPLTNGKNLFIMEDKNRYGEEEAHVWFEYLGFRYDLYTANALDELWDTPIDKDYELLEDYLSCRFGGAPVSHQGITVKVSPCILSV